MFHILIGYPPTRMCVWAKREECYFGQCLLFMAVSRSSLTLWHERRASAAALECGNVCFCSSSRSLLALRPNRLDRCMCLCVGVVSCCIPSWGVAESAENVCFSGLWIMCQFSWNISGMSKSGTYRRELKPHWRVVVFSFVVRTSVLLIWSGWLNVICL